MLEFKLNLYFEKYKEESIISYTDFKKKFNDENEPFTLFNELFNMIKEYQLKKYGSLIESGKEVKNYNVKKGDYCKSERTRMRDRFGTKEERLRRKRRIQ